MNIPAAGSTGSTGVRGYARFFKEKAWQKPLKRRSTHPPSPFKAGVRGYGVRLLLMRLTTASSNNSSAKLLKMSYSMCRAYPRRRRDSIIGRFSKRMRENHPGGGCGAAIFSNRIHLKRLHLPQPHFQRFRKGVRGKPFQRRPPIYPPATSICGKARAQEYGNTRFFDASDGSAVRHWLCKNFAKEPHPFVPAPGLLKYSRIFDASAEKIILEESDAKTFIWFNSFAALSPPVASPIPTPFPKFLPHFFQKVGVPPRVPVSLVSILPPQGGIESMHGFLRMQKGILEEDATQPSVCSASE